MRKLHIGLLMVVDLIVLGACMGAVEGNLAVPSATDLGPPPHGSPVVPAATGLSTALQMPGSLPDGDTVKIQFTLTNDSEVELYVLKWYTPLEGIGGEIFRVERDGQAVPYTGILAMRGDPTPKGYELLEAGQSASAEVDLASSFDFSQPGEYTIEFLSPRISQVARSEAEMARSIDDLGPVDIPANKVTVEIGGSSRGGSRNTSGRSPCRLPGCEPVMPGFATLRDRLFPHLFGTMCQGTSPVTWIDCGTATSPTARYGWGKVALGHRRFRRRAWRDMDGSSHRSGTTSVGTLGR